MSFVVLTSLYTGSALGNEASTSDTSRHSKGFTIQSTGLDSSMGFQRYHHGIGGWWQQCISLSFETVNVTGEPSSCWQVDGHVGLDSQQVPQSAHTLLNGSLLTAHFGLDVMKGVVLGKRDTKVGFFTGLGSDVLLGGIENLSWSVRPVLLTEIQIQIPLQDTSAVWINGGQRIGLHRANPSMSIGWGKVW